MNDNKGRVLTLVVTIEDPEAAKAIWDTHGEGKLLSGFRIDVIANGDQVSLCEDAMAMLPEKDYERLRKRE